MRDIGILGLGVMGANLALNMAHKGFGVSVYNWTPEETRDFTENKIKDEDIAAYYDTQSFIKSLKKPRIVYLMIRSGKPVDNMIKELLPYLDEGDLIMDGGNEHYSETERRLKELNEKGILYLGVGISGGESGALYGPSLMPGGSKEAYDLVKHILLKTAAQTETGPCCTYVGNGAAGHFVKMVHNGMEYGMMQALSESYDLLRKVLKLSADEIGDIFENWNQGELHSFLLEISYKIIRHKEGDTGESTLDFVLDKAEQKGTGKWTAQTSLDLGIPTPSLNAAVEGRTLSFFKEDRTNLSKLIVKKYPEFLEDKDKLIEDLKQSLLFTNFVLFSQGLWLIAEASKVYDFDIQLSEVIRIWKGGCIIRTKLIDFMMEIIDENGKNINLLHHRKSMKFLREKLNSIKYVNQIARDYYIPTLVHNTALDYFFSMIGENLPANLIQAQRDFFGAHTYRRVDKKGSFHNKWEQEYRTI